MYTFTHIISTATLERRYETIAIVHIDTVCARCDSGQGHSQIFLFLFSHTHTHTHTHTTPLGVYFSSRSSYVNKNDNILITDIGEGDCGALLCHTDLNECCHDRALGQWLYPNGSAVGTRSGRQEFYIDRGPSVVRLNRRSNAASTIAMGQFCCVVPDATSTSTTICINVVGKCH